MKIKIIIINIFALSLLFCNEVVFAAMEFPKLGIPGVPDITTDSSIWNIAGYFFGLAVVAGSFLGACAIIYAGINIFISQGNPSKISEAKKFIFGVLFGLLLLDGTAAIIAILNPDIFKKGTEIVPVKLTETPISGFYLIGENGEEMQLSGSVTSLATYNFEKKATSYKVTQPEDGTKYAAIFFSEADYRGKCWYGGKDATTAGSPGFKIASVFIFRTKSTNAGEVTLYNNDNGTCKELPETGDWFYPITKTVSAYDKEEELKDERGHWLDVSSLSIKNNNILVLLKTRDKEECEESKTEDCPQCQIMMKTAQNETCYHLKDTYVYNTESVTTIKPGWIKMFEIER